MKARLRWYCAAFLACPWLAGCNLVHNALHNINNEPKYHKSERKLRHELTSEAKETWKDYTRAHAGECFSEYFEEGFIDGFVDYLENGGNGEPPAMPPLKYRRNVKYLSPEGYAALEDYFTGFRTGSRIAISSGLRDTLVVPILVPTNPKFYRSAHDATLAKAAEMKAKETETLPFPKAMPEGTPAKPAEIPAAPNALPKVDIPKLDAPKVPDVNIPKVDAGLTDKKSDLRVIELPATRSSEIVLPQLPPTSVPRLPSPVAPASGGNE